MADVTIPIPDGLPADQLDDLVNWLKKQAKEAVPERDSFEDDVAWQQATARRIQAGIEAADAGEVFTSTEARRMLDKKLGIERRL